MGIFLDAAFKVLDELKKPTHYEEITRIAIEKGYLVSEGDSPARTMVSLLGKNINTKKEHSKFIKVGKGCYALKEDGGAVERIVPVTTVQLNSQVPPPRRRETRSEETVGGSYIGKAGEYLVCSELLFRGYNASIMSIDTGVDIVATKNNQLYGIQVKTSRLNSNKTFIFDIRKVSFERHNSGATFYVFVMVEKTEVNYYIVPFHELTKLVAEGVIPQVDKNTKYRLTIKFRGGKHYLTTLNHEINYYINRWDAIR